jgi:hypothetical protein
MFSAMASLSRGLIAPPLEEDNPRRHRNIERRNGSRHRDSNQDIAVPLQRLMQTFSFTPKNNHSRRAELNAIVQFSSALI